MGRLVLCTVLAASAIVGAASTASAQVVNGTPNPDLICLYNRAGANRSCVNGVEAFLPAANVTVNGLGGGDTVVVRMGGGCSCSCGFAGVASYVYGGFTVTLNGGDGNDTLVSGAGPNTLNGGTGNDFLRGGPMVDNINGVSGDDRIFDNGSNTDTYTGHDGNDCIEYLCVNPSACDCDGGAAPGAADGASCTTCNNCENITPSGTCAFACPPAF